MITYKYIIQGTDANGAKWDTSGSIKVTTAGQFHNALDLAQRETFEKLTQGRAVYGSPGVGCVGPYRFTKLVIWEQGEGNDDQINHS